jgi:hypothetical protein
MKKYKKPNKRASRSSKQRQRFHSSGFVKVGDLLIEENLKKTLIKGMQHAERTSYWRSDPRKKERELLRHYEKQKARRDRMLRIRAAKDRAIRRLTPQSIKNIEYFRKMLNECNRRRVIRSALFSQMKIGKGIGGSPKPKKYTPYSKIKC